MIRRLEFTGGLLAAFAHAEEMSILNGSSMLNRDVSLTYTASANAICDGGFKTWYHSTGTDLGGGSKEIVIELSEPKQVKSAFVQNRGEVNLLQKRMGSSAIYVGNDTGSLSPGMTQCSNYFFDSGFYPMTCSNEGKNVAIRRNGTSSSGILYNVHEVRLYQTTNLLELADVSISAPQPSDPRWAATNLITNLNRRSAGYNLRPVIDQAGATATWESCFKTGAAQLSVQGHKLVLQIDLGAVYFQHAILTVQDLFEGWSATDMNDPLKYFQNFEIYIGNSPNWADNPKCPDGPFMRRDDPNSFVKVTASAYAAPPTGMWKFGHEAWCNMEGRYLTIVADLSSLAGQTSTKAPNGYEMSLCHLGLFGALYKRSNPVPSSLLVFQGTPYLLEVEKITADAKTPIANTLDIMLRQKAGAELSWVTFTQDSLVTKVNIAPNSSVAPGDYSIVLESFDLAGGVFSALKTDTITVKVLPSECGQALSHKFDTLSAISVIQEYEPTIYFPEKLFEGPANNSCGGSYTQSIAISHPTSGVIVNDQPTGSDKRPNIQFGAQAPTGASFSLTFEGTYSYAPFPKVITASFTQNYKIKTVFTTEYIKQPTISHSLTAADLTFSVPPAAAGAAPPTHTLTSTILDVKYPIKAGTADALGNTPPVITPVPFTGFTSTDLAKGRASLGTASLTSPQGVLNVQGAGALGNHSESSLTFACLSWTMLNQDTTVTKTLHLANTVNSSFQVSIDVNCAFQPFKAIIFASNIARAVLTASVPNSWTLPRILNGSFPLKKIKFEPGDVALASVLTFDESSRVVYFDGSRGVAAYFGTSFTVKVILVDSEGNETPYTQAVDICPVSLDSIESVANAMANDPLNLSIKAHKVGSIQTEYKSKVDKVLELLAYSDWKQKVCGAVKIDLVSKHPFLKQVPESWVLVLSADTSTEPAVFDDAYLSLKLDSYNMKVPVRVEFASCQVTRLSFESSRIEVLYVVASGSMRVALPSVVQKPNCGAVFDLIRIAAIESRVVPAALVRKALKLDLATQSLVVATNDLSFVGKNAVVTIAIDASDVESKLGLLVQLQFASVTSQETEAKNVTLRSEVNKNLGAELGIAGFVVPQVTQEQADLLSTPIGLIEGEQLFMAVPLAARLSNGVDYVKQFAIQQKRRSRDQPDAHIVKFDNSGFLDMRFTSQMNFPDDILKTVETNGKRALLSNETSSRIEIFVVRSVDLNETSDVSPIIDNWTLLWLNQRDIRIFVNFTDPLLVSQGDVPDLLVVQLELSAYFDQNGRSLPLSLVRYIDIPRQMASVAQSEIIGAVGESAVGATNGVLGTSIILNILVAGSLFQVWSLINTLQIVQLTRLFDIKSPGNVNAFLDFFTEITSVRGLEAAIRETVDAKISLPETRPHSLNFQNAGYDTSFFVPNTRVQLCLVVIHVGVSALLLLCRILECCCACVGCLRKRVQSYLFWNGSMRLLMETFCDVMLFSMLNFYEIQWPNKQPAVTTNNWIAISVFTTYIVLPTALLICSYKKLTQREKRDLAFDRDYGALLQGTRRKREYLCIALWVPVSFFAKRLLLCISLVFLQGFFWGQIALQLAYTTYMIIYLQWADPLETPFNRRLETFNECVTLAVLYGLMYFSEFNPDAHFKNSVGFVFIAVVVIFAAVHLSLMAVDSFKKLRLFFMRLYNRYLRPLPKGPFLKVKKGPAATLEVSQMQGLSDQAKPALESDGQVSESASLVVDPQNRPLDEGRNCDGFSQSDSIPLKVRHSKPLDLDYKALAVPSLSEISEVQDVFEADNTPRESKQRLPAAGSISQVREERLDAIRERVKSTMAQIVQQRATEEIKTRFQVIGLSGTYAQSKSVDRRYF